MDEPPKRSPVWYFGSAKKKHSRSCQSQINNRDFFISAHRASGHSQNIGNAGGSWTKSHVYLWLDRADRRQKKRVGQRAHGQVVCGVGLAIPPS